MEKIQIVLASPSDLSEEREMIHRLVDEINTVSMRNEVVIDLRMWENSAPGINEKGPQGVRHVLRVRAGRGHHRGQRHRDRPVRRLSVLGTGRRGGAAEEHLSADQGVGGCATRADLSVLPHRGRIRGRDHLRR